MADKNYGNMIFPTSLNPAYAFPLDYRSLMTLEEAQAAASSAREAGNTNTTYYYGMTIQVIEGGVVNTYVITPSNTLKKVASTEHDAHTHANKSLLDSLSADTFNNKLDKSVHDNFIKGYEGKSLSTIISEAKLEGGSGSTNIDELKNIFVEKVVGKDLSTNDYTDADKEKLASLDTEINSDSGILKRLSAVEKRATLVANDTDEKHSGLKITTTEDNTNQIEIDDTITFVFNCGGVDE